jgi:hypothetical protein
LEGYDVVTKIESHGTSGGKPNAKITIADSGELPAN